MYPNRNYQDIPQNINSDGDTFHLCTSHNHYLMAQSNSNKTNGMPYKVMQLSNTQQDRKKDTLL